MSGTLKINYEIRFKMVKNKIIGRDISMINIIKLNIIRNLCKRKAKSVTKFISAMTHQFLSLFELFCPFP